MPIDLGLVKFARKRLKELVQKYPKLVGETSTDEWEYLLGEIQMSKSIQIGLRMEPETVELLDKFAAETQTELQKTLPSFEMTRHEAIRMLVTEGLKRRGYKPKKKK